MSIPWFVIGLIGISWERLVAVSRPWFPSSSRRGYRNVAVDEDAQVLRFDDED